MVFIEQPELRVVIRNGVFVGTCSCCADLVFRVEADPEKIPISQDYLHSAFDTHCEIVHPKLAKKSCLISRNVGLLQGSEPKIGGTDRLVRVGGGARTKEIPVAEWEGGFQNEAQAHRLMYQARVLGWGKEKRHYYALKTSSLMYGNAYPFRRRKTSGEQDLPQT